MWLKIEDQRASWSYRFTIGGKELLNGARRFPGCWTFVLARTRRDEARVKVQNGVDPIEAQKVERAPARVIPPFSAAVVDYIAAKGGDWCAVTRHQWEKVPADCDQIARRRIDEITTEDVLRVLRPVWTRTPESASRLRNRIERVISFAQSHGHIHPDRSNPARWVGHLENLLVGRKHTDRGHHAALPYASVPAFVDELRKVETVAARALEFGILCATRTGETRGAQWTEINWEARTWTIPGERMKERREHIVPLSDRALEILRELEATRESDCVFPGRGGPISDKTTHMLLRTMRRGAASVHGFRSTFRDWCGDQTSVSRELAEEALSHAIGSAVERAYRRSTSLEKRRALMSAWAAYCDGSPAGNVVTDLDAFRARVA